MALEIFACTWISFPYTGIRSFSLLLLLFMTSQWATNKFFENKNKMQWKDLSLVITQGWQNTRRWRGPLPESAIHQIPSFLSLLPIWEIYINLYCTPAWWAWPVDAFRCGWRREESIRSSGRHTHTHSHLGRTLSCDIERKRHFSLWPIIRIADRHHTLSASEYHCWVSSWAELHCIVTATTAVRRMTCLLLQCGLSRFPPFLSRRLLFPRSVCTEPRKTLSFPPFAHSNKQSVITGRERGERRAVLQIRHWHHCDDT